MAERDAAGPVGMARPGRPYARPGAAAARAGRVGQARPGRTGLGHPGHRAGPRGRPATAALRGCGGPCRGGAPVRRAARGALRGTGGRPRRSGRRGTGLRPCGRRGRHLRHGPGAQSCGQQRPLSDRPLDRARRAGRPAESHRRGPPPASRRGRHDRPRTDARAGHRLHGLAGPAAGRRSLHRPRRTAPGPTDLRPSGPARHTGRAAGAYGLGAHGVPPRRAARAGRPYGQLLGVRTAAAARRGRGRDVGVHPRRDLAGRGQPYLRAGPDAGRAAARGGHGGGAVRGRPGVRPA